jgi:PKD repeat protein
MNKIFTFLIFIGQLFIAHTVNAQCNPCPTFLSLQDTVQCNFVDFAITGAGSTGLEYGIAAQAPKPSVCEGTYMKYCLTAQPDFSVVPPCIYPTLNIDSIVITGGNLIAYNGACFTVIWDTIATANVTVYFTVPDVGSGPCRATLNFQVNLLDKPKAAFTANPQPACFNNPTAINFNSNATQGATSYLWNFGDGLVGVGANPTHNYTAPGTYTVCLTVANSPDTLNTGPVGGNSKCVGCVDSTCRVIVIDSLPAPDINCVNTVCAGKIDKYCTSASGCSSYNWSVVGGTIIAGANTNCITVQWGSGVPQGSISLSVSGCTGNFCTIGNTVSVPIIPSSATITGPIITCRDEVENYFVPTMPGTNYTWTLSSGGFFVGNNSNTSGVAINWSSFGTHTITCTYFNPEHNCGGIATKIVTVRPKVIITGSNTLCANTSATYNANYVPAGFASGATWAVTPSVGTTISGQGTGTVSIGFANAGTYTITTTVTAPAPACAPSKYIVTVLPNPVLTTITGPLAICPNGIHDYKIVSTDYTGFFTWTPTNGVSNILTPNGDSVSINWGNSGPYSIQVSQVNNVGCISNTLNVPLTILPAPTLSGIANVCADAIVNYTITNQSIGNFNWSVNPAQYGTILTGQGTNAVSIQWNGSNSPGNTNTVYLYYGLCGTDSIAINITDPSPITISQSGTLCSGGITLSTGVTGSHVWDCIQHAISPAQSNTNTTLVGINAGGTYSVNVTNVNGTGCNANASINIPQVGAPIASISTSGPVYYCWPTLPNITLSAATAVGYTYQWIFNNTVVGTGTTLAANSGAPLNINGIGTTVVRLVVTLGTCTDTSLPLLIVVDSCVPAGPPCPAVLAIDSIKGCNPFNVYSSITGPIGGSPVPNSQYITHLDDLSTTFGTLTKTYTSIGYKPIRVCSSYLLPNNTTCDDCYDTTVLVTLNAKYLANQNCGVVNYTNLSQVVAPTTIASYAWSVTTNPGNNPVPPIVASFNNASSATPILTFNATGNYFVTLTITGSNGCTSTFTDTISSHLANAAFTYTGACVGTGTSYISNIVYPTHYWNFGDGASSYTTPTSHTYATANVYTLTHAVVNAFGCKDTDIVAITINPKPPCVLAYTGSTVFCSNDSLVVSGCVGYTSYQWYRNGLPIPSATGTTYTINSTGLYYMTAFEPINACLVISDTVSVNVSPAPTANITITTPPCEFTNFQAVVDYCQACNYSWLVDGTPVGTNSFTYNDFTGTPPLAAGVHTLTAIITNPFGCSALDSVVFTINPQPTISTSINGPLPICSNNIYTIDAVSNAVNPSWVWTYSGYNFSTNDTVLATAAGIYFVNVTDGVTGCTAIASNFINASPDLRLFPTGCDTLCDTTSVIMPLPSVNFNIAGYTIDWYDNAPPFTAPFATGISILTSSLSLGNHQLSVVVSSPNGCNDTSNIFDVFIKSCTPPPFGAYWLQLNGIVSNYKHQLYWQDADAINTQYYIIYYSTDGLHFTEALKINASNNKNNHYELEPPVSSAKVFYKIAKLTQQGHLQVSNIIELLNIEAVIRVSPTITTNYCTVYKPNTQLEAEVNIYTLSGTKVSTTVIPANKSSMQLSLLNIQSGLYLVKVTMGSEVYVYKVVRQ